MRWGLLAAAVLWGAAGPADAQVDLLSPDAFSALIDLRISAAHGERSWTDDGFGKTRYGGGTHGSAVRAQVADADLVWTPVVGDVTGVVDLEVQPGQHRGAEVAQAYVLYRPLPTSETRVSLRAGLYYPDISLEHGGYAGGPWTATHGITPSAINTWVGQELKVVGVEPTVRTRLGGHEVAVSGALFVGDDTSGTLLALRGWSLDDVKGTAGGRLPLPALGAFLTPRQAAFTEPVRELDHRLGVYARGEWRPPGPLRVDLFYYDNRGNAVAVDDLQWSWATRFWNLGLTYQLAPGTRAIAQVMSGSTRMGYPRGKSVWVDVDYQSAFLLLEREVGPLAVTGRIDAFTADNAPPTPEEDYGEHGFALTAGWRYAVSPQVTVLGEVLHVESRRPQRRLVGLDAAQASTTLQAALRLAF